MVKQYTKRPVIVDALQWTGVNQEELYQFVPAHLRHEEPGGLYISTPEGDLPVCINDFIVCNGGNWFVPVRPSVFAKTYEEVKHE